MLTDEEFSQEMLYLLDIEASNLRNSSHRPAIYCLMPPLEGEKERCRAAFIYIDGYEMGFEEAREQLRATGVEIANLSEDVTAMFYVRRIRQITHKDREFLDRLNEGRVPFEELSDAIGEGRRGLAVQGVRVADERWGIATIDLIENEDNKITTQGEPNLFFFQEDPDNAVGAMREVLGEYQRRVAEIQQSIRRDMHTKADQSDVQTSMMQFLKRLLS